MSKLRPECTTGKLGTAMPNDTALYLISAAVAKRRSLIYGKLDDDEGRHCAMGAFWEDNPTIAINSKLVDEVATVNDSLPRSATPYARWKKVNAWLQWKLQVLTAAKGAR